MSLSMLLWGQRDLLSFPTRRSSDLSCTRRGCSHPAVSSGGSAVRAAVRRRPWWRACVRVCRRRGRSEEHTSELQSLTNLVCRLLLDKNKHALARLALQRGLEGDAVG